jgi:flagellar basal-body rod modification protein FlgD
MIRNVQVGANRGSGASVSYTLTDGAANVQVSVLNATGKPVARLNQGSRAAGAHTATWNGRSNDGVALPAGMYQLQITATSEEGEVARHTAPLVLIR